MTDCPWKVWSGARCIGSRTTRQAAMNVVDRPYMRGRFVVRHEHNGEAWTREKGIWRKTAEKRRRAPRRQHAGAATAKAAGAPSQGKLPL